MSNLPEYRRKAADPESSPFLQRDNRSSLDLDQSAVPAYPPSPGRIGSLEGEEGRINVTYTFVPRWPVEGEIQDAIGVIGRNRNETLNIVHRGFPMLASYEIDRIELLAPVHPKRTDIEAQWGLIMDEAWIGFQVDCPTRIQVRVRDRPGDHAARVRRERIYIITVASAWVIGVIGTLTTIAWLSGAFEHKVRHASS